MWIHRRWKSALGLVLSLGAPAAKFIDRVLGVGGNTDFVISRTADPGWIGVMLDFAQVHFDLILLAAAALGLGLIWLDTQRGKSNGRGVAPINGAGYASRFSTTKELSVNTVFVVPEGVFTIKVIVYAAGGGGSFGGMEAGKNGGLSSFGKYCAALGGCGGLAREDEHKDGIATGGDVNRVGGGGRGGDGISDSHGRPGTRGGDGGFASLVANVSPGDKVPCLVGKGGQGAMGARRGQDGHIVVEY